ncbi:hypothetical protein [Qipengyuania qiaonensis]|uniref:DUF2612 domain-containing protein n=1 Tax=Qipengyuania qiaonensis TaxID=2867240 RepID=A0ABS7JFV0_9SPHN|nr:hypothetical protein [Qipengyuania qiaonensis]MBX7483912.1 hypothetical protein [Qipengyuania qiaonensis]
MSIEVPRGVHPQEDNLARTQDLAARLATIDPLLDNLSLFFGINKPSESLPPGQLIREMTLEDWRIRYEKGIVGPALGSRIGFWNRKKPLTDQAFGFNGKYNVREDISPNNFFATRNSIPPTLIDPAILNAIVEAFVDSFDANRADVICMDSTYEKANEPIQSLYMLWLDEDAPYPIAGEDFRLRADHPPPSHSEPWLGGTRYIWPEHEPRAWLGLDPEESGDGG